MTTTETPTTTGQPTTAEVITTTVVITTPEAITTETTTVETTAGRFCFHRLEQLVDWHNVLFCENVGEVTSMDNLKRRLVRSGRYNIVQTVSTCMRTFLESRYTLNNQPKIQIITVLLVI